MDGAHNETRNADAFAYPLVPAREIRGTVSALSLRTVSAGEESVLERNSRFLIALAGL